MGVAQLIVGFSRWFGKPIPVSRTPAPVDAAGSELLRPDPAALIALDQSATTRQDNIVFARPAGRDGNVIELKLDLLIPTLPGRYPLVIYLPGGGFVNANRKVALAQRNFIAGSGYVVASVQYRVVKVGAGYLDAIADVRSAIRFLREHADDYSIAPERVAVWGESAGGYLAAMVGATNGSSEKGGAGDDSGQRGDVDAVINMFGGSDLSRIAEGFDERTRHAHANASSSTNRFLGGAGEQADPSTLVTADSPPFLHFHGTEDRIVSPIQTALLHAALLRAGTSSVRYLVEGAGHGPISLHAREARLWNTTAVMGRMTDFLAAHLTG